MIDGPLLKRAQRMVALGAHLGRQFLGDRVAADHDRALDRPRGADRLQHVGDHRRRQRAPLLAAEPGGQPLLGGVEALDG